MVEAPIVYVCNVKKFSCSQFFLRKMYIKLCRLAVLAKFSQLLAQTVYVPFVWIISMLSKYNVARAHRTCNLFTCDGKHFAGVLSVNFFRIKSKVCCPSLRCEQAKGTLPVSWMYQQRVWCWIFSSGGEGATTLYHHVCVKSRKPRMIYAINFSSLHGNFSTNDCKSAFIGSSAFCGQKTFHLSLLKWN